MWFKKPILILFFFSFAVPQAQNSKIKDQAYFNRLIDSTYNFYRKHDYKQTITLCTKIIEEGEANNVPYARFVAYDMLGSVYDNLDEKQKSLELTQKALEVAIETKNDSIIAWANLNMGNAFAEKKETYQKSVEYLTKSLNYYKQENRFDDLYLTYINIAWTLLNYESYDEAFKYILKAKKLSKTQYIPEDYTVYIKFLSGRYYYYKKKLNLAKKELLAATKHVDKDSIFELGEDAYAYLKMTYQDKGDYFNAYKSLEKEKHYSEKNHKETRQNAIQVASAKLDLEEYKTDLKRAIVDKDYSKKTSQLLAIIIGILVVAVFGFFKLFSSRRKFANKLHIKNKELLIAKEESEKLSKVKNQFFSTVSHELRTPLYGVIGLSSILKDDIKLKEYEEELNSLKFSADYLLALINDVLLLNKMDYQDLELEKVPFRLDSLIKSIEQSFKFSLEQNKNKLIIDVDKTVPNYLLGSSIRLSQILMNLIGNATKFNENGTIWFTVKLIETTKKDLYKTKFIIKDNGIGIPKHKQETIFEEFSQVVNNNYSHKGTGLGLPIVKKLLQLHNSDIELKSDLGKGSEFSFILDLEENKDVIINEGSIELSVENVKNTINELYRDVHVLVVDDNKINQKVTQNILAKNNIKSDLANDGEEAVKMTRENSYSLILMDINMPKLSGIEATKIIRTFNTEIPIIALTAVEVEEMRIEIMDSGMNDILSKPYGASQFLSTILKNLSMSRISEAS